MPSVERRFPEEFFHNVVTERVCERDGPANTERKARASKNRTQGLEWNCGVQVALEKKGGAGSVPGGSLHVQQFPERDHQIVQLAHGLVTTFLCRHNNIAHLGWKTRRPFRFRISKEETWYIQQLISIPFEKRP